MNVKFITLCIGEKPTYIPQFEYQLEQIPRIGETLFFKNSLLDRKEKVIPELYLKIVDIVWTIEAHMKPTPIIYLEQK